MNQKGFIPIIFIIIGAVVFASATFGVVKYKDEITANVSKVFKGSKVETPNIDSAGKVVEEPAIEKEPIIEEPEKDDTQQLQGQLRIAEQKRLEAEKQLEEERAKQEAEKLKVEQEARKIIEEQKRQEELLRQQEITRQQELEKQKKEIPGIENLIKQDWYKDEYECRNDLRNNVFREELSLGVSELTNLTNQVIENQCEEFDQSREYLFSKLKALKKINDLDFFNQEVEKFLAELKKQQKEMEQVMESGIKKISEEYDHLIQQAEQELRESDEAIRKQEQKRSLRDQKLQELEEINQQILDTTAQRETEIEIVKDERISMARMNRKIDNINEKYRPILRNLYLQRQQIIDWLNYNL